MITLGIHAYTHDSAAALVRDGEIIAAAEEERFNGHKHTDAFPAGAVSFCLERAGVSLDQVDVVAVAWQPFYLLGHRVRHFLRHLPLSLRGLAPSPDGDIKGNLDLWNSIRRIPRTMARRFGPAPRTRFVFLPHHDCHAASAYYTSPFARAGLLTCDACGEWETSVYYQGAEDGLTRLGRDCMPHSLGLVYGAFTQYLGFKEKCDEGKVMALAAMAEPAYLEAMGQIFGLDGNQSLWVDTSFFRFHYDTKNRLYGRRFTARFGPAQTPGAEPTLRDKQIAASMQLQCENVLGAMLGRLRAETGCRDFCLSGGVALNSKANGKLLEEGVVDSLLVHPAANDAGTALGAALLAQADQVGRAEQRRPFSPYLGPESTPEQCGQAARESGLYCLQTARPAELVARLLTESQVVAWHQGRMEWGPRALGNRSILADPRDAAMKDRVNAKVKFREAFRPFAPAILAEAQGDYFACGHPVPHMTHVLTVRPHMRERIPAVVHVDGTARLQTVAAGENPDFHRVIKAFERLTGVPVVMNTSLNVQGMPIALEPRHSLTCLRDSDMDYLCLGSWLLCKDEDKFRRLKQAEAALD